jgi:hypothetical protein
MSGLGKIAAALSDKKPQGGGSGDAGARDPRTMSMSPREANMAKMSALGISSMPDGGQDELDQKYAAHVKAVQGAK